MAKTGSRENTYKNTEKQKSYSNSRGFLPLLSPILRDNRVRLALGLLLLISSFSILVALLSYFFTGRADQSVVEVAWQNNIKVSGAEIQNWLGVSGAMIAHLLIFRWFGVASFIIVPLLFILGWRLAFRTEIISIQRFFQFSIFFILWTSVFLGYVFQSDDLSFWSGGFGYEIAALLDSLLGMASFLIIIFALVIFMINFFDLREIWQSTSTTRQTVGNYWTTARQSIKQNLATKDTPLEDIPKDFSKSAYETEVDKEFGKIANRKKTIPLDLQTPDASKAKDAEKPSIELEITPDPPKDLRKTRILDEDMQNREETENQDIKEPQLDVPFDKNAPTFTIEGMNEGKLPSESSFEEEKNAFENQINSLESQPGDQPYDPKRDLSHYKYPTVELLNEVPEMKRQVTNEELEANKDRIVATLSNYGIGISQIKATIGPTVTLYEIIPEAGVRISKIKNLEDDIALSLAALGIRIIAPIPGKGTIGIEVPNKRREIVAMRSVLEDEAFTQNKRDLPIILGKTIANEVYVADLAKMPHLLMAGATGQGKSVGLNTFMLSLIYKKHPSELKFVLIDPKKVEMSLFNHIEKHFLAKLPGEEEAIITDNKKVVHTLNSLTVEMDNRYELLKNAGSRNLKEYNRKFTQRKLNPRKGHRYLPHIVLIIDELADLMMMAGKEVEQPIARLAQLARAVGIHLIVATQRPSVNIITGIIKANFPARLSFKVTSKVDSRTILDMSGAEQLVGMGDMLFTVGSEVVRLQGAFVDTLEVERICDFIGEQQGFPSAYELPEFMSEEDKAAAGGEDDFERDDRFEEAARILVMHQQGSTSLLQRRMKLGYNRAGRLIDQLEKVGIVGPFEGSKAREVLIKDEYSLERLLNSLSK